MPYRFDEELQENTEDEQKKPIVISMFTHKGGVGKTTGTYNLGALLAKHGARVLLVDADPQCNLSKSYLQAAMSTRRDFHLLDDETKSAVVRKVARLLLKFGAREEANVADYTIEMHINDEGLTSAEAEIQFAKKTLKHQFVIYRQCEDTHSENSEEEASQGKEPSLTWHLYGETPDGEKQHIPFSFSTVIGTDRETNILSEMTQESTSATLTAQERKQLLLLAAAELDHLDYDMEEFFADLISSPLVLRNDLSGDHDDLQNNFVLTQTKKGIWRLYYCPADQEKPSNIEIDNVPGLKAMLSKLPKSDLPESLNKETVTKIERCIKRYRFVNFLEAFNRQTISESVSSDVIHERARRLSLLKIKPSEVNSTIDTEKEGELLLLPGNYSLLLDLARQFSFGIEGLKQDTVFSSFSKNIYGLNEFTRFLAESHGVDVVLLDLSPSADDFNATMMMLSDYFLTTVNPDAYSDDAIESLTEILARWKVDFAQLYARKERHSSGCRLISGPPQCLGYFLQKMNMQGDKLASKVDTSIAREIKTIFDSQIVPLLKEQGMYPSFGLTGYNEEGQPKSDKIPHGIPMFRRYEKNSQHKGIPVVWSGEESSVFQSAFERILVRTVGRAIVGDSSVVSELRERFVDLTEKQEGRKTETFAKKWSDRYFENRKIQTFHDRQLLIKNNNYRLDYFDMLLAIATIRYNFNARTDSTLSFNTGSSLAYKNNQGALLLDPCTFDQIGMQLRNTLEEIRQEGNQWPGLNYIIIPFFNGTYWMCARAQFNVKNQSISLLVDDPYGGAFDKTDIVPGDPRGKVRNIISPQILSGLTKCFIGEITSHMRMITNNRQWSMARSGIICKHVDQLGYLARDVGTGVVILSNIEDYLEIENESGKLCSNRGFEKTAKEYKAQGVLHINNLSHYSHDDQEDITASQEELDGTYTLHEYKKTKKIHSQPITDKRKKFAGWYDRHKVFYRSMHDDPNKQHINQAHYLKYFQDYLHSLLLRVPADRIKEVTELFEDGNVSVTLFISMILFKVFYPLKPTRETPYGEGDMFRSALVGSVVKSFSKKRKANEVSDSPRKPSTTSRTKKSRKKPSFPKAVDLPYLLKRGCLNNDNAATTLALADDAERKFSRYQVVGDGDCGYNAFGIRREKAYELIFDNLKDPAIIDLLKSAINEQMIEENFIDFLSGRVTWREEISTAYEIYKISDQKDALLTLMEDEDKIVQIIEVYLEYDIQEKNVDNGWCHPCVLQALAHIQNLRIRMWILNDNQKLIPYETADHSCVYADYNKNGEQCVDLLFVDGNHFDKLIEKESLHSASSSTSNGSAKIQKKRNRSYDDSSDDEEAAAAQKRGRKSKRRSKLGSKFRLSTPKPKPASKNHLSKLKKQAVQQSGPHRYGSKLKRKPEEPAGRSGKQARSKPSKGGMFGARNTARERGEAAATSSPPLYSTSSSS